MKFYAKYKEINEALLSLNQTIPERDNSTGILTFALFMGNKEHQKIKIFSDDGVAGVETEFEAQVEEDFLVCIRPKELENRIKNLVDKTIEFEFIDWLHIKADRSFHRIPIRPGSDFPRFDNHPAAGFIMEAKAFRKMFAAASIAKMKDQQTGNWQLKTVFLEVKNKVLTLTTCDGFRVARARHVVDYGDDFTALIPQQAIQPILRFLSNKSGNISVQKGENRLVIEGQDDLTRAPKDKKDKPEIKIREETLYTRLIDGKYPETDRIIPKEFKTSLTVSNREILGTLKSVMSSSHNEIGVRAYSDHDLNLWAEDANLGMANEFVLTKPIVWGHGEADRVDFYLPGKTVIDAISDMYSITNKVKGKNGDEYYDTVIEFNDDKSAIKIQPINCDFEFTFVVMPINPFKSSG